MRTHVFIDEKEFQQYFLQRRNVIAKALLKVKVHTVSNHVYISINELIDHVMSHGVDFDWYTTQEPLSNGISQSKAIHKMVNRLTTQHQYVVNAKVGYIILWSDAFQINFVRTKTASTWILTLVLSPPRTSAKVSLFHTYVIGIGNKSWVDGHK